ncbi:MAG: phosphonate C-P lyase system protein PhnG [Pseudomonadota bacterium]
MSKNQNNLTNEQRARQARLSVLATASSDQLKALWHRWTDANGAPEYTLVRAPEIGTVMVRGRAGAVGAPFNLGEITVTRCSVQLANGAVGHGYVQGRDKDTSLAAALIDALALGDQASALDADIIGPLQAEADGKATERAEKAAATKVEFFTMVRGEG